MAAVSPTPIEAPRSRTPRRAGSRGNFELYAWLFMRISGLPGTGSTKRTQQLPFSGTRAQPQTKTATTTLATVRAPMAKKGAVGTPFFLRYMKISTPIATRTPSLIPILRLFTGRSRA